MERFTQRDDKGRAVCRAETRYSLVHCTEIVGGEPIERFAELEDKLKNGQLVELPCKVGDEIWYIVCKGKQSSIIQSFVSEILLRHDHIMACINNSMRRLVYDYSGRLVQNDWEVYLVEAEAEARLKELQEK